MIYFPRFAHSIQFLSQWQKRAPHLPASVIQYGKRAYEEALLELDPKKLLEHVHTAEAVIFNRLQALAQIPDSPEHAAERQAMEDALNALRVLKRNKLNFPDWEKK